MAKEWYKKSFGKDYLLVYTHRDMEGAYDEVRRMMEWLELPEGAEVLDLCCGMGRHSMALTSFGFQVTGVDLSEVLLTEAKRWDKEGEIHFLIGDMRQVPLSKTFDAVVNLFTSFGYFEEESDNEKVLKEIDRLLKPGGRFIIDFLNPSYVKDHLVPYSERTDEGVHIEERRRIEDEFVRKTIILREVGKPDERVYEEQVKLIERDTFLGMLSRAGLTVDAIYGGYDASPYDQATSKRMIFTGHKEA